MSWKTSRSRSLSSSSSFGGARARKARELLDDASRDRGREEGVARSDRVDGGDQLLGRLVLEDEAARACSQRLVDVLVEVERREDQHPRGAIGREDAPRRLEPVELRHADVHENDGRIESRRLLDGLEPVRRLRDDLDVLLAAEEHPEARPHHRLVVGDENADRHEPLPPIGRRALRTNPPSRRRPRRHLPPVDLHALADPDETMPPAVAGRGADAVVPDDDPQLVRRVGERHLGARRVGVLERVRRDPPARSGTRTGRSPAGAGRARRRRGAAPGRPARLTSSSSESRLSTPGCGDELDAVAVAAHRTEEATHLGERGAAGLLDVAECLLVLRERSGQLVPDRADLEHHDADRVGDDVVELARDAGALFGDGDARGRFALTLRLRGTRLGRLRLGDALAEGEADGPAIAKMIGMNTSSPGAWLGSL